MALAAEVEKHGFLTGSFGVEAGTVRKEAEAKLALTRQETATFRALLSQQGKNPSSSPPVLPPARDVKSSLGPIDRLEGPLGRAIASNSSA